MRMNYLLNWCEYSFDGWRLVSVTSNPNKLVIEHVQVSELQNIPTQDEKFVHKGTCTMTNTTCQISV